MYKFGPIASKLLQKYRMLLRKNLSKAESAHALEKLQLHMRLPQKELDLYHMLVQTVKHFERDLVSSTKSRYSGSILFLRDMNDFLKLYRVQKNELIHAPKAAARALVHAIQIVGLPESKRTKSIIAELNLHMLNIAQFGIQDQQTAFLNILKKNVSSNRVFFSKLLKKYERYLKRYASENVDASENIDDIEIKQEKIG